MKKILPLLIIGVLLLTSCSLGGLNTRRQFFTSNDRTIANEKFEKIIEAIQNAGEIPRV